MDTKRTRSAPARSTYVLAAAALVVASWTVTDTFAGDRHRVNAHARGAHVGVVVAPHGPARARVHAAHAPRYRPQARVRFAPYRSAPVRYHVALDVPTRIPRRHLVRFDAYRAAPVFHRGHGHRHTVYLFPVRSGRHVVTRPHAYCGSRLHAVQRGTGRGSWILVAGRR